MKNLITIGLPSKGRLKDKSISFFNNKELRILQTEKERNYFGSIENKPNIKIITGKGLRSKNTNDPYQSKDLSILKYSIPNFIKNNKELMDKIFKIDESAIESPLKGSFEIVLKNK